ncbi:Transposon Ty3-G Gag-Pol poly [Paramuricea clavata]|uniref:Transposon Ty3-G Gag-Pol poly n=1 Tax=Paramuricea clavata TaxID=317549 RepID=A0A6S7FNR4_PARCT|nr:Transposon Ty3-G Gag-Pol poly [Paramuricea clavata]
MICDRIVVSLIDANVLQKLQFDPDLTLKKAEDIVRETDAVKKEQSELRNKVDFSDNGIDSIRSAKHKKSRREQNNKATGKSNQKDFPGKQSCFRCGKKQFHSREKCPARNSMCNKCSKVGHWAKVCRTKMVAEVVKENSDDDENYEFLGEVSSQNNAQWKANLKLDGQVVQFKLDTGADETCISLHVYESMKTKLPALKKSKKKLHSCDGKKLDIYGIFVATIEADKKITVQDVYVIKGLHQALLGGPAIRSLNLLQKAKFVETVKTCSDEAEPNKKWKSQSPKLFKGLGRIKNEYTIKLKSDAKPHAVYMPRKIAHPRLLKVKNELDRMEN